MTVALLPRKSPASLEQWKINWDYKNGLNLKGMNLLVSRILVKGLIPHLDADNLC